jgi:plasmid stabilization system protein ParE
MGADKLVVHPAFFRRLRHYRDRIALKDSRPRVAAKFVKATQALIHQLARNPGAGHSARFEAEDLRDILRATIPGFSIFAVFYRWDASTLTVITVEHTAQDLPARLAAVVSKSD